jgi:hypothetical protein
LNIPKSNNYLIAIDIANRNFFLIYIFLFLVIFSAIKGLKISTPLKFVGREYGTINIIKTDVDLHYDSHIHKAPITLSNAFLFWTVSIFQFKLYK